MALVDKASFSWYPLKLQVTGNIERVFCLTLCSVNVSRAGCQFFLLFVALLRNLHNLKGLDFQA